MDFNFSFKCACGHTSHPCNYTPKKSWHAVPANLIPPGNEVWGKVTFSEVCVKNSVHRGGGSVSVHAGIPPPLTRQPQTRHPPGSRHPLDQAPPLGADPPGPVPTGSRSPQTRYPPGSNPPDQTPPLCAVHAGRCGKRAGGMHPTGMQSCCYLQLYNCIKV